MPTEKNGEGRSGCGEFGSGGQLSSPRPRAGIRGLTRSWQRTEGRGIGAASDSGCTVISCLSGVTLKTWIGSKGPSADASRSAELPGRADGGKDRERPSSETVATAIAYGRVGGNTKVLWGGHGVAPRGCRSIWAASQIIRVSAPTAAIAGTPRKALSSPAVERWRLLRSSG
jgi:hypothetical protein